MAKEANQIHETLTNHLNQTAQLVLLGRVDIGSSCINTT